MNRKSGNEKPDQDSRSAKVRESNHDILVRRMSLWARHLRLTRPGRQTSA